MIIIIAIILTKTNNPLLTMMYIYFLNQIKQNNFGLIINLHLIKIWPMEMLQPKFLINNNLTNGQIKFSQIKLIKSNLDLD